MPVWPQTADRLTPSNPSVTSQITGYAFLCSWRNLSGLVQPSKWGDEGKACFSDATARRLEARLRVRLARSGVDEVFVFIGGTTPRKKLTTRGLCIILRKLGQRAGIEDVSPHAFRRAFACLATKTGAPGRVLKDMGWWSDIKMVELYIQALDATQLFRRYNPIDFIENNYGECLPDQL